MFFEIDHLTHYDYSVPVQLGEHLLRFRPRPHAGHRTTRCRLTIDPAPLRREEGEDRWGNPTERVWFRGETNHLEIRTHLEVETSETARTSGLGKVSVPPDYGSELADLRLYLEPSEDPAKLQPFLQPLLVAAAGDGLAFLHALNRAIHGFYHRGVRLEGHPRTPAETLALGEGVCRDLTVLFMAACRQAGLAARFVSGYQQGDGTREQRYLHAWPEVYLPGDGWLGYDPTHGTVAGADHIAVAAAPDAPAVAPVEGGYSFSGATLTSTLKTDIRITARTAPDVI
jgi:transglutaminase-like putative cysteine protease